MGTFSWPSALSRVGAIAHGRPDRRNRSRVGRPAHAARLLFTRVTELAARDRIELALLATADHPTVQPVLDPVALRGSKIPFMPRRVVFVDESAEEVPSLDCPGDLARCVVACFWWLELECAVWPLAVVVRRVGAPGRCLTGSLCNRDRRLKSASDAWMTAGRIACSAPASSRCVGRRVLILLVGALVIVFVAPPPTGLRSAVRPSGGAVDDDYVAGVSPPSRHSAVRAPSARRGASAPTPICYTRARVTK
jgi:hypothetical protein